MIPVILPTDRLRIAALAMGAFPVPMIFGVHAVKKIEKKADPHRRMAASLRSPEEATDDRSG